MGILTLHVPVNYDYTVHLASNTILDIDLPQLDAGVPIRNNSAILRSITTTFNGINHGFYEGTLLLSWFDTSRIHTAGDSSGVFHPGINLRWDGTARSISNDVHLNVGMLWHELRHIHLRLQGKRSSNAAGPVYADSGPGTWLPAVDATNLGPLSVTLVFEYNEIHAV